MTHSDCPAKAYLRKDRFLAGGRRLQDSALELSVSAKTMAKERLTGGSGTYGSVDLETLPRANRHMRFSSRFITAFLLGATLVWTACVSSWSNGNARETTPNLHATPQSPEVSIFIYNWYSKRYGKIGSPYPWLGKDDVILDVAMPCFVEVLSLPDDEEYEVRATHASTGHAIVSHTKRKVAEFMLTEYGSYTVTVARLGTDASDEPPIDRNPIAPPRVLHAMRVRHEVRELHRDDRDRLLDTMKIMWEMGGETGRRIYGNDFVSAREFQIWHHINAAQRDADHFHQVRHRTERARMTCWYPLRALVSLYSTHASRCSLKPHCVLSSPR